LGADFDHQQTGTFISTSTRRDQRKGGVGGLKAALEKGAVACLVKTKPDGFLTAIRVYSPRDILESASRNYSKNFGQGKRIDELVVHQPCG
jgi:hypothetical protein